VSTVGSVGKGELVWRGELNDDRYIWLPFDFVDELCGSLVAEEGAEPVLEGYVVDLAVFLDDVRRFQDHDELGIVGWLVGWASLAHGV